jgi:hypothetical protein
VFMTTSQKPCENLRSPPPPAAPCLTRDRLSSQKGGTLVNESVADIETHKRWMLDLDRYRPAECKKCHHPKVHMHDRRQRVLLGDPAGRTIQVAIYLCAACRATWRILPRFLARHLWRRWAVVQVAVSRSPPVSWPKIAKRTSRRWLSRLHSSANHLTQLLATSGEQTLSRVAANCGLDATRETLVVEYSALSPGGAQALADISALSHRLLPGVRLM